MDAVELISLYSTLFYVSMALCLLGLVLAVVFFFVFDIRKVYTQLTGRGKERLMQRHSGEKSGPLKKRNTSGLKSKDLYTAEINTAEPVQQQEQDSTSVLTQGAAEQDSTTVLAHEAAEEATTVLSSPVPDDMGRTSILHAEEPLDAAAAVPEGPGPAGSFEIFESVIEIHTDERI